MKAKYFVIIVFQLIALSMYSCTTLNKQGAMVIVISNPLELKGECLELGQASGYGPQESMIEGFAEAEIELRNEAAKLGGNYVQIIRKAETLFGWKIFGIAYLCEVNPSATLIDDETLDRKKDICHERGGVWKNGRCELIIDDQQ